MYQLYLFSILYERQSEIWEPMYDDAHTWYRHGTRALDKGTILSTKTLPLPVIFMHNSSGHNPLLDILAIYSFKNDRARDLLFELATHPRDGEDYLAGCAAYCLSLLPNSAKLLPQTKILLKEAIANEQKNNPDRAERVLDESGDVVDLFLSPMWFPSRQRDDDNIQLFHRAQLVRALEFNEKIPDDELERFRIVRLEVATTEARRFPTVRGPWVPRATSPHATPLLGVDIPQGYEHFEIYFQEYKLFGPPYRFHWWWGDGYSYQPVTSENPYWKKRKALFERELENPIYTERQREYIRTNIRIIEGDFGRNSGN